MRHVSVTILLLAAPLWTVVAQPADTDSVPPEVRILIQSELDYLGTATQRISIVFDKVTPERAIRKLGKRSGLKIEVQGTLPGKPKLTRSFDGATLKEILIWYAEAVPVVYRVEGPDKLLVLLPRTEEGNDRAGDD